MNSEEGLSIIISVSAKAQSSPKMIAVINRADWCPACKANGAKVMKEVIPACKDLGVQFLTNDCLSLGLV